MATQSTTAFGALLRKHRLAAGLTQEALAERAGLSVYGIQKLEAGTTHPYRDTAQRLVTALDLPSEAAEQLRAAVEPVRRHGTPRREQVVAASRHNLPAAVTSFVGREQELVEIPRRLRAARLLTLTGAGGSGKTRLANELARSLLDDYRDGVWLVELAQVTDPALVPHRLAAVLAVHETSDRPMTQALAEALRDTSTLVVLDNCEHVLNACASLVDLLLRECPNLHILTTSREPIGIPGEISHGVPSLATPAPHQSDSVAEVERSPAVNLFVDRASALQPGFALAADNAHAIAQICRRLDGIPLALELAAACLDALTPDQLASRLDQRFRLLTDGNRAALPRQQTLRATVDWSYQLLTDTQQRVFERLSVFASGWTLEAAEVVCAGDGVDAADVLDAGRQLVRKSLIVRIDVRYGLQETLRDYAFEKLQARPGDLTTKFRERHAAYYSEGLSERLNPAGPTTLLPYSADRAALTTPVIEILDSMHDNVRVALRWWLDARRPIEALVLLRALCQLWIARGAPVDAQRWVYAVLNLAAEMASKGGDSATGMPRAEVVPAALHAQGLLFGSIIPGGQGDPETARRYSQESIELWRSVGDEAGLAQGLISLGFVLYRGGEFEQADLVQTESLALARAAGQAFTLAMALTQLGIVALLRMQLERAEALLRESLTVAANLERANDRVWLQVGALGVLGRVVSEQGIDREASVLLEQALARMREAGIAGVRLSLCLGWMATVLGKTGDPLRAATVFGAADAVWRTAGTMPHPLQEQSHARDIPAVQAQLGQQSFADAYARGQSMTVQQAIAYALGET